MREVRSIGVTRPLVWSEAIYVEVDFCVWVLLRDGLLVPPFDSHPDGSGELRAAGLTAPGWRAWMELVIAAQDDLSQRVRDIGDLPGTARDATGLADHLDRALPPNVWSGADAVGERLRALWIEYQPEGETWRRDVIEAGGPVDLSPRDRRRLWGTMDLERTAGRSLATYFVRYPAPVAAPLPPDILVVALGQKPNVEAYGRLLRQGIADLEALQEPGR